MFKKWFGQQAAKSYFLTGENLVAEGKYEQAIEHLSKAIEIDANFFDAYLRRGSVYVEMGDVEHGLPDLNFVLATHPDLPAARYYRGKAYLFSEKPDLALSDLDHAIQFDPNEPANYLLRCGVHSFKKEYDQAVEDATKAINLGFEEEGFNNRAIVFTKKEDYQAAIADWTKVIEFDADNVMACCKRGILYAKIGQADHAIIDLERGLKNNNQLEESLRQESEILLEKLKAGK